MAVERPVSTAAWFGYLRRCRSCAAAPDADLYNADKRPTDRHGRQQRANKTTVRRATAEHACLPAVAISSIVLEAFRRRAAFAAGLVLFLYDR